MIAIVDIPLTLPYDGQLPHWVTTGFNGWKDCGKEYEYLLETCHPSVVMLLNNGMEIGRAAI